MGSSCRWSRGKLRCRGAGVQGCWCAVISGTGLGSWQENGTLRRLSPSDNCWVRLGGHARDGGSQEQTESARQGWVEQEERCGADAQEKAWESRSL